MNRLDRQIVRYMKDHRDEDIQVNIIESMGFEERNIYVSVYFIDEESEVNVFYETDEIDLNLGNIEKLQKIQKELKAEIKRKIGIKVDTDYCTV